MHLVPSFGSQQAWYILVILCDNETSIFTSLFTHRLDRWRYFSRRFSAILIGFAVAQFFPTIDSLFVVAIFATSLTSQILGTILVPAFCGALFPNHALANCSPCVIFTMAIEK